MSNKMNYNQGQSQHCEQLSRFLTADRFELPPKSVHPLAFRGGNRDWNWEKLSPHLAAICVQGSGLTQLQRAVLAYASVNDRTDPRHESPSRPSMEYIDARTIHTTP
jgi:hypothetical protein